MKKERLQDRLSMFFFLLIVGVYILSVANFIAKPLVGDEWMSRSIAETITSSGKLRAFGLGDGMSSGLWLDHPPLYQYIIVLFFKMFGIGDVQARLVGVVFCILSLLLVYLMTRNLYPENKFAPIIASLLFGLSPMVIQGSRMIEIDQALLIFTATLFLYSFLRSDGWPAKKRILLLGLTFFLAICSKFSLPPRTYYQHGDLLRFKKAIHQRYGQDIGNFFYRRGIIFNGLVAVLLQCKSQRLFFYPIYLYLQNFYDSADERNYPAEIAFCW